VKELSRSEMVSLEGGIGWTWCGIAVGLAFGATVIYGGVGFALTVNKAFVACIIPAVL
jgi:hypothetical protein